VLKLNPDIQEFVPKSEAFEFIPGSAPFVLGTESNFNIGAQEFVPGGVTLETVTPPKPAEDTPVVKSPEPSPLLKLVAADAAETGSSDSEAAKLEVRLVPDPRPSRHVYSPDQIRSVSLDDRTRVITLGRVRELAERKITEVAEMKRSYLKKLRNEPVAAMSRPVETQLPSLSPIWRMERTREQVVFT
jgi:hypothetical protein